YKYVRFRISIIYFKAVSSNLIEPVTTGPGIYFDPVGKLKLTNDDLHILIPIDISYIKPHIDNLISVIATARHFCQQSKNLESKCLNILEPMTPRLEDIIRDYESISHLITDRSKKSAWFSGIGTIFKHIFGTMDEQDAIKYSTAIHTLKGNDKKLSELMRDNILMTTTALLAYNDSLNSINKNEHRLNEALDALSCNIYNITLEIN
ncbi:PREDICTED: uncharacterized protein LOC106114553, partial [Papilio xuthus]|uniref:Uncharacterized protein LOC106114553 n=1 Tax=Papilio xuthus TaxID=66420 RepID=A0AAJ6Z1J9_PAPXU